MTNDEFWNSCITKCESELITATAELYTANKKVSRLKYALKIFKENKSSETEPNEESIFTKSAVDVIE